MEIQDGGPSRLHSPCKDPGAGPGLVSCRSSEEGACVGGAVMEGERGRRWGAQEAPGELVGICSLLSV